VDNVSKITPEEAANRINVQAYGKILWRKKFYLLVPLVLAAVISVIGVRHLTPIYESKTMLLIEEKSMLSQTMERYIPSTDNRNEMRDQRYRALIETRVKSRDFLELVINELGLEHSDQLRRRFEAYAPSGLPLDELIMRHLVGVLKEKIDVQNPQPGFFTIGVYDTDPTTAHILAERISESFIDVTNQEQIKGIRQAGTFSDEQLAIYKEKLDASERELARVKREMSSSAVESNPVNATNIRFAQAFKQTIDAAVEKTNIDLKKVRGNLSTLFGAVPSSERISTDEAIMNYIKQLDAYGEEKLLNELRAEPQQQAERGVDPFAVIGNGLNARIREIVAQEYGNVAPQMQGLIAEYFYQRYLLEYNTSVARKLQSYLDQFNTNLDRKPALEREYNRLTQEVETNRAIHKAFQESKTSARISEAAQTTNLGLTIRIIERAEKPLVPVKPDVIKVILIAVLAGGMCGLGSIFLTEYLDDSFRSVEEVERVLQVPVLGTIPKIAAEFAWEKKKQGMAILYWFLGIVVFVALVSGALYYYANALKSSGLGVELHQQEHSGDSRQ
jgi:succinoglycan biosynthesis transport protein ExoP